MNFITFLRNMLWMVPFKEKEKHDYYGELPIFFLVYPYRFFVAISIIAWIFFGILYAYPLLFVWSLSFVEYILCCIYDKSPRWKAYAERKAEQQISEAVRLAKIDREIQNQKLLQLHRDDPPKPITKLF